MRIFIHREDGRTTLSQALILDVWRTRLEHCWQTLRNIVAMNAASPGVISTGIAQRVIPGIALSPMLSLNSVEIRYYRNRYSTK